MRAPGTKSGRRGGPAILAARLGAHVALEAQASGEIAACFDGLSVGLGQFSKSAADRAGDLRIGLPLSAFAPTTPTRKRGREASEPDVDKEIHLLVRRLAAHGLLEYRLGGPQNGADQVVIEPQVRHYWPQTPALNKDDVLVLSRFAYLRRRANDMVLESPRAGALFKICDPKIAAVLAMLSKPQPIKRLRRQDGFPGLELFAVLVDCQILFKVDAARPDGLRPAEGGDNLVLWDFHDLLFHARSTEGRHANPLGGVYPYVGGIDPPPAVRPRWPGKAIDLSAVSTATPEAISPAARLLRDRHSTRSFDDRQPITLAELSRFLDSTARVQSSSTAPLDPGGGGPLLTYTVRPYPSGGSGYELELYLAVDKCEGLPRGFYHYDAGGHALVPIGAGAREFEASLKAAEFAMDAPGAPQILITIAARFGRMSWKYSSIAYALILKDVGVLTQTFYVMATDMGLGGCAIGIANIDLFAKMTGIDFHVEGPVGQFALGRGAEPVAAGR